MRYEDLFEFITCFEGVIKDESVIQQFEDYLAHTYQALRSDPLRHVNGSVPTKVNRASGLRPGVIARVEAYRIKSTANLSAIRSYLEMRDAINTGALGLTLIRRSLPKDIWFISFEENEPWRLSFIKHREGNAFDLALGSHYTEFTNEYGFICFTAV